MAEVIDLQSLVVSLEASTTKYERALERANALTKQRMADIDKSTSRTKTQVDSLAGSFSKLRVPDLKFNTSALESQLGALSGRIRAVGSSLAAALSLVEINRYAEAWTKTGNMIAAAGVPAERVAATQQKIADIAIRSRAGLSETADLYAKLTRSSKDLGASQADIAAVTETVVKSLKLSGATAGETEAAVLQLGQALSSGRLGGDELRSLLENAPVLAGSIAKEFGVAVGGLKDLGAAGALTSDRVFKALKDSAQDVEAAFAKTTPTVSDAFQTLQTEAIRFVGTSNLVKAGTSTIASAVTAVARNFDTLGTGAAALGVVLAARLAAAGLTPVVSGFGSLVASSLSLTPALASVTTGAGATAAALSALRAILAVVGGVPGAVLLGLGAALAYAATQSADGSEASKRYAAALEEVRGKADQTRPAIEGVGSAVEKTSNAMDAAANAKLEGAFRTLSGDAENTVLTLRGLIQQLEQYGAVRVSADEKAQAIAALNKALEGDAQAATAAREELQRLGQANPSFANAFANIEALLQRLAALRTAAQQTRADIAGQAASSVDQSIPRPSITYDQAASATQNDPILQRLAGQGTARRALIEAQEDATAKKYREKEAELRGLIQKGGGIAPDDLQATARAIVDAEAKDKGGRQGKSDTEKRAEEIARSIRSLDQEARTEEASAAALGRSNAEKRTAVELAKLNVDATSAEGLAIAANVARIDAASEAQKRFAEAQATAKRQADFFNDTLADGLTSIIVRGDDASAVFKRLTQQILEAALKASLFGSGPLGGGGGGLLGGLFGGGGGGGGLGGLLGGLFGGGGGGGVGGLSFGLLAGLFHDGGIVGGGGRQIVVSPEMFNSAPRFHTGLKAGEMAAILERGEAVLTQEDQSKMKALAGAGDKASSGGSGLTVNVTNAPSTPEVSRGANGELNIDFAAKAVEGSIAKRASRGQGAFAALNSGSVNRAG